VKYLRDELDWPIETENFEDLTFDYAPEELGLDAETAVKIKEIKQLRPLTSKQPWGIFFVNFAPKQLPVVALRRILSTLVIKKRQSSNQPHQAAWRLHDLLFISSYGETEHRDITFAHFAEEHGTGDLPTLRLLGWDDEDTKLKLDFVERELKDKLRWPEDEGDVAAWRAKWSTAFRLRPREVIKTSQQLAIQLADLARGIRKRANNVLAVESDKGPLRKMHAAFKEALIHDLSTDDFADMYAQTISYGLLTARFSRPAGLVADNLADMVPVTNPFLKDMLETFLTIGGRKGKIDFDELGINDVVHLLRDADMEAVLRDFGDRNPQEDPVIHFYELFLKEYDAKKRMQRGVFYTPRPVVSFIVRSVHEILQKEFSIEDGLASTVTWGEMAAKHSDLAIPAGTKPSEPFVVILDPATGTGTFLVEAIDIIHKTMEARWKKQGHMALEFQNLWNEYVPKHLLPRLNGYELLMAPYAIAHMKIGLKLFETGYRFSSNQRARIYLTNSLEPASDNKMQREFEEWAPALAHEAQAVNDIKRHDRFTVVIGNPPYAGHSANQGEWITDLLGAYYFVEGKPLKEANSKWLQDDYVKFIRLGQYEIQRSGVGVLSFITNHGYIDNPTFRGMRSDFLKHFRSLYISDLHGNTKKKERSEDGSSDDNVFDIQQGVAIFAAVRSFAGSEGSVNHCNLRGAREHKYRVLSANSITTMSWREVEPATPFWLFVPQDVNLREEYESGVSFVENAPECSLGILTKRDSLLVDFSRNAVFKKVEQFADNAISDSTIAEQFGLPLADKDTWNLRTARRASRPPSESFVRRLVYRPFDFRYVYYHEVLVARMNRRVLGHLDAYRNNLGIILGRQGMATGSDQWDVCYVCDALVDQNVFRRGGGTVFPLHLTRREGDLDLGKGLVNLSQRIEGYFAKLADCPEDIFHYAYSVFHSLAYRNRYAEFLKIDFPRLPITSNRSLFRALARVGGELVALHLLKSSKLVNLNSTFIGSKNPEVERVSYAGHSVWLNKEQTCGFKGVPEAVWNFHIGGYQVCEKWLKDRKGRTLSKDDIAHYNKIVVALSETIRLMKKIDEVIDEHGGWPCAFVTGEKAASKES
jgi:predicted helicase